MNKSFPSTGFEPFYFGASKTRLYGCYHSPGPSYTRNTGIVLCYPTDDEYIYSHRAFRQLAVRLANAGFPVLRFDYYGCGDSSGEFVDADIHRWQDDISKAIEELKVRSGTTSICLIGRRLGGTLSMLTGIERDDVESIVLWDVILKGKAYVSELISRHKSFENIHVKSPQYPPQIDNGSSEFLGFTYGNPLLDGLNSLDLLKIERRSANRILFIESNERPTEASLMQHFEDIGTQIDYQHVYVPTFSDADGLKTLVPNEILRAIVTWISGASS